LNPSNVIELQLKFIQLILNSIKTSWDSISIHFEYFDLDGENYEKYVANIFHDGRKQQFHPGLDALDVLIELNKAPPEGQSERWSWVEFVIDKTGKYKFDYKYGLPPLVAEEIGDIHKEKHD
jgi:hypothetical protein